MLPAWYLEFSQLGKGVAIWIDAYGAEICFLPMLLGAQCRVVQMDTAWRSSLQGWMVGKVVGWRGMDEHHPQDTEGPFPCVAQEGTGLPPVFSSGVSTRDIFWGIRPVFPITFSPMPQKGILKGSVKSHSFVPHFLLSTEM